MADPLLDLRNTLGVVLLRDLEALRREVELYPDDESLWKDIPGISNCGGTLALHVAGNLQTFVGHVLGGIPYVRDRDREFSARNVPRGDVLKGIDATIHAVDHTMRSLDPARLAEEYPMEVVGMRLRTDVWLMHLVAHLAYHLGQIDYHRRAATRLNTTANAISVPALGTVWP